MPKLKHYDSENTVRFITFSCYRRQPNLNDDLVKNLLIEQIKLSRMNNGFKLLGYVIMPEHVHLVIYPKTETKIGMLIGTIKKRMSKRYFGEKKVKSKNFKYVFWEKRCYDHNCRKIETVREKIRYCHRNPMTRGLVEYPGDWNWSSFNWYRGKRDVPITIDEYET